MNHDEFLKLTKQPSRIISVDMLVNQNPRTLLWGYTCARESFHLYLADGQFHLLVYQNTEPITGDIVHCWNKTKIDLDVDCVVPDKRLYPSKSDYEFCLLLKKAGAHLPFTSEQEAPIQQYYGAIFPLPEGNKVHRFTVSSKQIGTKQQDCFTSDWYTNKDRCFSIVEKIRQQFHLDFKEITKDYPFIIFITIESGIKINGKVSDIIPKIFPLDQFTSKETMSNAANGVVPFCQELVLQESKFSK